MEDINKLESKSDFEKTLDEVGIELYEGGEEIKKVESMIVSRVSDNVEGTLKTLGKLENDEELEGEDYFTIVADLVDADFSKTEIKKIIEGVQSNTLSATLQEMISGEKIYLEKKLNNPEFLESLKGAKQSMQDFVTSIGRSEQFTERYPKIVYAGKTGRMIIRSNKIDTFDTHAVAGGEYLHEDNTAYMFMTSDESIPAGKKVLECQIHETVHAISKNEISENNNTSINKSGFGQLEYNKNDPNGSNNEMRSFNEGTTEYFARKFCADQFTNDKRDEHDYDTYVGAIETIINKLSDQNNLSKEEVEKEIFKAYMEGDVSFVAKVLEKSLGKFSKEILNVLPKNISEFIQKNEQQISGETATEKVTLDYEQFEKQGIKADEFLKTYPFVKLIRHDYNRETFEPVEIEITE